MRKYLFIASAAALISAAPATAQSVTGTVNITGSVGEKCLVTDPGPAGSTFTTTIDLGELAGEGAIITQPMLRYPEGFLFAELFLAEFFDFLTQMTFQFVDVRRPTCLMADQLAPPLPDSFV